MGELEKRTSQEEEIQRQIEEIQRRAKEIHKEEYMESHETGEDFDEVWDREYNKSDKFNEYIVNGALLTCTQATLEPFIIPNDDPIELDRGPKESEFEFKYGFGRKQTRLNVGENHLYLGKASYATVKDTVKDVNITPFQCNCAQMISSLSEIKYIRDHLEDCKKNGVCKYLMRLNEEWANMPLENTENAITPSSYLSISDVEEYSVCYFEGITRTSVLVCKRGGGLIIPLTSGQDVLTNKDALISEKGGISKKALRALMELEILNTYSLDEGYLVIDDGKLIGIKPHLAGDGRVTFGFGDCLQEGDIEFYKDAERNNRISGYLSDKVSEYNLMKDTVIPVDICFEKMIQDITPLYEKARSDFEKEELTLSQNQLDALSIIKYQCYTIGSEAYNAILNNDGREKLYEAVLDKHGRNGDFEFRTNVEMNIYYEGNYDVEGGLSDIIVEPLEEYEE